MASYWSAVRSRGESRARQSGSAFRSQDVSGPDGKRMVVCGCPVSNKAQARSGAVQPKLEITYRTSRSIPKYTSE